MPGCGRRRWRRRWCRFPFRRVPFVLVVFFFVPFCVLTTRRQFRLILRNPRSELCLPLARKICAPSARKPGWFLWRTTRAASITSTAFSRHPFAPHLREPPPCARAHSRTCGLCFWTALSFPTLIVCFFPHVQAALTLLRPVCAQEEGKDANEAWTVLHEKEEEEDDLDKAFRKLAERRRKKRDGRQADRAGPTRPSAPRRQV